MLKAASEWPNSLPLFLPQPQVTDGDKVQQWGIKHLEEFSQHGYSMAAGAAHILPGTTLFMVFMVKYIYD